MKLIIQIPCYNEEKSLPVTLNALPKMIPGIDKIEVLIIDDGSQDRTVQVATELGVHHVVRMAKNSGLAKAFIAGLEASICKGADIIVNTDADNQYNADDIAKLVAPILEGRAEFVIGARPIMTIQHFSYVKKLLQLLGSWAVRAASNTMVPDAPSGFRAMSRRAAMQLNVFNSYTYTLETIIEAGHKGIATVSVPIRVNGDLRPSRLVKSIPNYIRKSLVTIIRIFIVYKPFRFFAFIGSILFVAGAAIGFRFLYYFLINGGSEGHVQSLILSAVLLLMGFITGIAGILADLISVNRRLSEQLSWRLWQIEESLNQNVRSETGQRAKA